MGETTDPQRLEDVGVAQLLSHLKHYSDVDFDASQMHLTDAEVNILAKLFIQQLTQSLNGKLIAGALNSLRHGEEIQYIIDLYCYCELEMTPRDFYAKWDVTYEQISHICDRSLGTVQCWFNRGEKHRPPKSVDLRHLAIMDFLLEHFEEIPKKLRTILCFRYS